MFVLCHLFCPSQIILSPPSPCLPLPSHPLCPALFVVPQAPPLMLLMIMLNGQPLP